MLNFFGLNALTHFLIVDFITGQRGSALRAARRANKQIEIK
jgi:hypothetical protein